MILDIQIITWKYFFGAGILGLFLSTVIIIIVLKLANSNFLKQRKLALRDQHLEPVSRFGGIGLFWGFLGVIFIFWILPINNNFIGLENLPQDRLAGLCIGALFAWLLGLSDDLFNLRVRWKLLGQILISILAIILGFEINRIQLPFLQNIQLGIWSWPITIIWIVGIINSINLIDGLDGLASGLTIVALIYFGAFCWWQEQFSLLLIIFILIGVTIGFLAFNKPQASIFMGDSGSMFLGYVMAVISIWTTDIPGRGPSVLPILILAVPIIDTGFALFRRFFKGIPFYSADKDHLHHRLIARGFSVTQAIMILIGFSALFGFIAIMAFKIINFLGFSILLSIFLTYILLYWLGYEEIRDPFGTIKHKYDHRKRRLLMLSLSEEIDDFFAKDPDLESVFRSFHYFTKLANVSSSELKINGETLKKSGELISSHKILSYKIESFEVILTLDESSSKINSDQKENLLEKGSIALIGRLRQIKNF